MKDYNNEIVPSPFTMNSFLQGLRAAGGIIGLITMLFGLTYASKVFMLVFDAIKNPEAAQNILSYWVQALSQGEMDLMIRGTTTHGAPLVALATLGALLLILAWLSIKLITTGAQILSWILGDAKAVKKLLSEVFSPGLRPEPHPQGSSEQPSTPTQNTEPPHTPLNS